MSSVKAVSDTEYSEGDDNSGMGLSDREEGLTTSVGNDLGSGSAYFYRDPGSGSAYFYRDSDPWSSQKTKRISNTEKEKTRVST